MVKEVADDVSEFSVGDAVFGGHTHGAYAEEIVVPSMSIQHKPAALTFAEACGIFVTLPTSYAGA